MYNRISNEKRHYKTDTPVTLCNPTVSHCQLYVYQFYNSKRGRKKNINSFNGLRFTVARWLHKSVVL